MNIPDTSSPLSSLDLISYGYMNPNADDNVSISLSAYSESPCHSASSSLSSEPLIHLETARREKAKRKRNESTSVKVIGHRGAKGYALDNSLESFSKAIEMKVDIIELDVQLTKDDVIICYHDVHFHPAPREHGSPLIKEEQDLNGIPIRDLTYDQISKLLPMCATFQQVLEHIHKECARFKHNTVQVYMDIKGEDVVTPLYYLVKNFIFEKKWEPSRFMIATFDQTQMHEFNQIVAFDRNLLVGIQKVILLGGIPFGYCKSLEELCPDFVCVGKCVMVGKKGRAFVKDAHERGFGVYVYTANRLPVIKSLIDMGVDGVCTDYIDRVHEASKLTTEQD